MHPNVKKWIEKEFAAQKSEEWLALRGNLNYYSRSVGLDHVLWAIPPQSTVKSMKMRLEYSMNNVMVRSYTNLVFVPIRSITGSVGAQMV
jgi:hypothetical protein